MKEGIGKFKNAQRERERETERERERDRERDREMERWRVHERTEKDHTYRE